LGTFRAGYADGLAGLKAMTDGFRQLETVPLPEFDVMCKPGTITVISCIRFDGFGFFIHHPGFAAG